MGHAAADPRRSHTLRSVQDSARQAAQLHGVLGLGSTAAAGAFGLLYYLGVAPLLPQGGTDVTLIAYALSGLSVVVATMALLVFRPRVPPRLLGQTASELWSSPPLPQAALLVWSLLDGAAVLASIGFLLTGHLVPAVLMPVWLAVFWLHGPSALTRG